MLATIRLDYQTIMRLGSKKAAEDFAARMEQATCYLMLRMWAEGLYTADGWTIQRIEHRSPAQDANVETIINLRPFNRHTRRFFQGE